MRILLTGGSGQVGQNVQRRAPAGWQVVAPPRRELDLSDPEALAEKVAEGGWDAVVSSGAYTAVDRAETDVVAAWAANALGPAALAATTRAVGIPLLHISTDYVFDGAKDGFYVEDDPVAPLGVYGASKEAGEQAVRTANPRHLILRTSWVVSAYGANFIKTMLRLGADRPELRVVADQRGCPTSAADIADTILAVLPCLADGTGETGTFQFVNMGEATWAELANHVFARAESYGHSRPTVHPITTADYPAPARRPANSRLETAKLRKAYGIEPRPWGQAVDEIINQLCQGTTS